MSLAIAAFACQALMGAEPQTPPPARLKAQDIDQFCKNYPAMQKDIEALGAKQQGMGQDFTIPQAVMASSEFKSIMKKYGLDEAFGQKMSAICQGYALLMTRQAMQDMTAQMNQAMEEMDKNPNVPAETKQQMKTQMDASTRTMKETEAKLKAAVHQDDVTLLEGRKADLEKVFKPAE